MAFGDIICNDLKIENDITSIMVLLISFKVQMQILHNFDHLFIHFVYPWHMASWASGDVGWSCLSQGQIEDLLSITFSHSGIHVMNCRGPSGDVDLGSTIYSFVTCATKGSMKMPECIRGA